MNREQRFLSFPKERISSRRALISGRGTEESGRIMDIVAKFRETVRQRRLIEAGDHILLAYSAGADSTALLALLLELQKNLPFRLSLAHFNHGLRKNAVKDEEFALAAARERGLPLYAGGADVAAQARERRLAVEEAGRLLRYEFLRKIAGKVGANKIATAHTMTDQAETFLLRLLRGSGPRGLGGIFPAVEGLVIRPLIDVERKEIDRYLKTKKLAFRIDESNLDKRFLRNRVRLNLIPYLEKHFEPGIVRLLARTAEILRQEDHLLDRELDPLAQKAIVGEGIGARLEVKSLSSLHPALARRLVRRYFSLVKGDLRRITFQDVETILDLGEGKDFTLREGIVLRREAGWVVRKSGGKDSASSGPSRPYLWDGMGSLEIEETGFTFAGQILTKEKAAGIPYDDGQRALVDYDLIEIPLRVRRRAEGDRYRPAGAPGRQRLKEVLRAKRIPVSKRNALPVFLSGEEIVWVVGAPVAEKFKVTEKTRRVLRIERTARN